MNTKKQVSPSFAFARYAALGLPLAFASLPLYVHVPKLYSTVTPLGLAAIGTILLAVRSLDMVIDPFIGSFSDTLQSRRQLVMAIAVPILALGYFALFYPLVFEGHLSAAVWLTGSLVVTYAGFSVLMINYYAMGVGLAHSPNGHTRVALWREAAMLVGVLAASILPSVLMGTLTPRTAYGVFAVILSILLIFSAFVTLPMRVVLTGPARTRFLPFALLRNRRICWLLAVVLIDALPLAITSTLFLFFVDDVLGVPDQAGLMLGLYFISAVIGMPLWSHLSTFIGKVGTLFFSMLLSICFFIWAALLGRGDAHSFYVICFLSGMTLGADAVLLPAIFAEELDAAQAQLGSGFGWWNFLNKAALALAAGIALPLLAAGGYRPGAINNSHVLALLSASYALFPCGCKVVAAGMLYFSPLARKSPAPFPSGTTLENVNA